MSKEIVKRTTWSGKEVEDIYEDGRKIGETKVTGKDWSGNDIKTTYDNSGHKVSETKRDDGIFGGFFESERYVTKDNYGRELSETKVESNPFGGTIENIYQDGENIADIHHSNNSFGNNTRVYGKGDIDLTTRTKRKSIDRKVLDIPSTRESYSAYLTSGGSGYNSGRREVYDPNKVEEKEESGSIWGSIFRVAVGLGVLYLIGKALEKSDVQIARNHNYNTPSTNEGLEGSDYNLGRRETYDPNTKAEEDMEKLLEVYLQEIK